MRTMRVLTMILCAWPLKLASQAVAVNASFSSWQPVGDVTRLMTPSPAVRADVAIRPTRPVGIEIGTFLVSGMNAHLAAGTTLTGVSLALALRRSGGAIGWSLLPTVSFDALSLMNVPGPDVVRGTSLGVRGRADWRFARPFRVFAELGGSQFTPTSAGQRAIDLAAARPSCVGTCVPRMSRVVSYTFTTGMQILVF